MTPPASTEPVIVKEYPYLLLYWDILTDCWEDSGIFETIQTAQEEVKAIVESFDEKVIDPNNFVIIPNDGEAQRAFRPLDCGDRYWSGKAIGSMEKVIITRGLS